MDRELLGNIFNVSLSCINTFACTLTIHPPVTFPFLEVIIVELLSLHLLDLVLADTLPHNVGDRGGDQTKMDVNLHSRNRKKGWCHARLQ